ncbi:CvpA family protein [Hominisplanchenecus murintestinalis]|uniref:CvpA family protein n=1 Tax=Hominisplanchenecus murintestinalis TaxID=2941517 RepID=A0AC61QZ23_9FIRM|nr:CvpA family protein [Hominisplanchenecus murintestinalis]TGX98299.1 CvpA family protein [Hominisplanchenecus murintestinalis]
MKKIGKKAILILAAVIIAAVYYYVTIPAINIHSSGFWVFIAIAAVVLLVLYAAPRVRTPDDLKTDKGIKVGIFVILGIGVVYLIGSVLSSPIVNANKYQQLITVENRKFTEDIKEVDYRRIPLLDRDSATLLGNRKMGSMVDMVSQFEVSSLYTQINYQDTPVRVTPLVYANLIKWFTNQSNGIPAYIKIDMATQDTELVKLEQPIRYSQSEHFNRNINRHLRFRYPTYIFDELSFEIDDEGTPYWVCPVKKFNIGLFGGVTIGRVVLCNAVTGETADYAVEDCPNWVDHVFAADLLTQLYDYHGTLQNGFINSVLGQKGCLMTTDGYNYLALEDDVWVYTGITSVSGDESNVGFVLMNQRTMECRYYEIAGAQEYSAMASAEGQVQNLGYQSTFPLLLNISGEPTYFMALKDAAGLVKKYAMVNIKKYQNVAIGDTVAECEKSYNSLLRESGIRTTENIQTKSISGKITKIAQGVVDGNSHYYLMLEGNDGIFDVSVVDYIDIIRYTEGDKVTLEYQEGELANVVLGIK